MSSLTLAVADYLSGTPGSRAGGAEIMVSQLEAYAELLRKWGARTNLVSRETLVDLEVRHLADSLQLLAHVPPDTRWIVDLGSGGGLPGIPLAIARPDTRVTLIEASAKKGAFLRSAARKVAPNAEVETRRIEAYQGVTDGFPDVITSRALAALPDLCELMLGLFGPNSRALLHKGRDYRAEVEDSRRRFSYDLTVHRSRTDSAAAILEISGLRRR